MGTHPIFESDFDCLTEKKKNFSKMPPKAKVNKKAEMKKKDKTLDDKTFGLKNKKGGKAQKYIAIVEKQVASGGRVNSWAQDQEKKKAAEKKAAKEAELAEMQMLFGKAITAKGTKFMMDPKAKKAEKKTAFSTAKDPKEEEEKNDMANWTEEQLREAVEKKHGKEKNKATTTDKICNEFIKAVESKKYGWFWECSTVKSGKPCKYRHVLPEGFVLESEKKALKAAQKENQISLEDLIERERAALGVNQTRITLESFSIWKAKKQAEKKKKHEEEEKAKTKKAKSGQVKGLTGRELFAFEANIGGDDDEAEDIVIEREEDDDDTVKVVEIDDNFFAAPSALHMSKGAVPSAANDNRFDHLEKGPEAKATPAPEANVEVDEDLFGDDDLDDIDAELGDMALNDAGMES